MEGSHEPVKPSPEGGGELKPGDPIHPFRPPGLEMIMGLGLFFSIMMVWFTAQAIAFTQHPQVVAASAEAPLGDVAEAFETHGDVVGFVGVWGHGSAALVLLLFLRLWKRKHTGQFLGTKAPTLKPALLWTGIFVLLAIFLEVLVQLIPALQTDYMVELIGSASQPIWLFMGACVAAPIFEELAFRGLLIGSLRHVIDKHAAIAIASGVFTMLHIQYPWPILLTQVLPLAVVLGYARTESGSIWLPIGLHVLANSASMLLTEV